MLDEKTILELRSTITSLHGNRMQLMRIQNTLHRQGIGFSRLHPDLKLARETSEAIQDILNELISESTIANDSEYKYDVILVPNSFATALEDERKALERLLDQFPMMKLKEMKELKR